MAAAGTGLPAFEGYRASSATQYNRAPVPDRADRPARRTAVSTVSLRRLGTYDQLVSGAAGHQAVDGDVELTPSSDSPAPQTVGSTPAASSHIARSVFALQHQIGNRAVSALLSRSGPSGPIVQRKADEGQAASIRTRANAVAAEAEEAAEDRDEDQRPPEIDPSERRAAAGEQQGSFAQPDKVSTPAAETQQAATQTQAEADAPADAIGEKEKGAERGEGKEIGPAEAAAAACAAATEESQAAVALAEALPEPEVPTPVEPPLVVSPVDSTGAPLPVHPGAEAAVGLVAAQIGELRSGAYRLALDARANHARSHVLRAGIVEAHGKIDEASGSIETVQQHVEHRRGVVEQANTALEASNEKADTVAAEAPGIAAKADEGREDSGPMASEASELAVSASSQTPDDAEAAAKAQEQGGQINQVSGSLTSIDSAIGQTGERARSLQSDAEQAKGSNAESASTVADATAKLDETDGKLAELMAQNEAARSRISGMADRPAELATGAETQARDAATILAKSHDHEARLRAVQEAYAAELRGIPGPPQPRDDVAVPGGSGRSLSRTPIRPSQAIAHSAVANHAVDQSRERQDSPGGGRERVAEFDEWAGAISGDEPTEAQRAEQSEQAQRRQLEQLAQINAEAGGDFSTLDAGERAGLALRLTFTSTFNGLSQTNWPKFGADILRGFVDPRVSLAGVVSGLGMIASGGANLLSLEQWGKDPLGNLLKSAADIATGVTTVLGSIAGLAVAIIAISAALILLSWGFLSPVLLPVISFCGTVAATVGPWALTAAKVAIVLNALVFIKNLIDAATATTAQELLDESNAMGEDIKGMAGAAMEIVGDSKMGQAVGARVSRGVGAVRRGLPPLPGGGTRIGANVTQNLADIGNAMSGGPRRASGAADSPTPAADAGPAAPRADSTAAASAADAAPAAPRADPTPAAAGSDVVPAADVAPSATGPSSTALSGDVSTAGAAGRDATAPTDAVGETQPADAGRPNGPDQPGLPPDFEVPDDFTFVAEGPVVSIPAHESGDPARVLEIGAGPTDTNLGLPVEPGQGNLSVHDSSLVDVTRSDIQPRPGVVEIDATQPIPADLRGQDAVVINNPRGYPVDVATIGEAVRPGGRIIIQGRAEVVPGMRGINPDMNPILERALTGDLPPGYRCVEVVTLPDVRSGNPAVVPKPGDVMGGPFQRTTGPPVSWPNTRIVIERVTDVPSGAVLPDSPPASGTSMDAGARPPSSATRADASPAVDDVGDGATGTDTSAATATQGSKPPHPATPAGFAGSIADLGRTLDWPRAKADGTPVAQLDLPSLREAGITEAWARAEAANYQAHHEYNPNNPTAKRRAEWLDQLARRLSREGAH